MHAPTPPPLSTTFGAVAERLRRAGQPERAVALCREGLAVYPLHLSARVTLGCALLDLGDETEAHRELSAVVKRAPDNLAAIRALAELHARGIDGGYEEELPPAPPEIYEVDLPVARPVVEAIDLTAEPIEIAGAAPPAIAAHVYDAPFELEDVIDDADDDIRVDDSRNASGLVGMNGAPSTASWQQDIQDIDAAVTASVFARSAATTVPALDVTIDMERRGAAASGNDSWLAVSATVVRMPEVEPSQHADRLIVLGQWLARIRARRAEILSEYAAG